MTALPTKDSTKDSIELFKANFRLFLNFYNGINNSSHVFSEAIFDDQILAAYQLSFTSSKFSEKITQKTLTLAQTYFQTPPPSKAATPKSTKGLSFYQFISENGTGVANDIYQVLKKASEPLSRAEIADELGIRIATVCGQIDLLKKARLVKVAGFKIDEHSKRKVETLKV